MKEHLEPLVAKYESLPQRDRMLVVLMAAVLGITLFYLVIWEPVFNGLERQKQQYKSQQDAVTWMQEAAAEVKTLKRSGVKAITSNNQPVSLLIEKTAKVSGVTIGKLESSGKEGARVVLDATSFDQMLIWLNTLEKQHGIQISSASIERAEAIGTINARLTFSRS